MPCHKCKGKNHSLTIKTIIWCFDNWMECLKKYSGDIFYTNMEQVAVWKIKMLELEHLIFQDLKAFKNSKNSSFELKDASLIFKQIDLIMWDVSRYSIPFRNIWTVIRFHPQWLRLVK